MLYPCQQLGRSTGKTDLHRRGDLSRLIESWVGLGAAHGEVGGDIDGTL
jgi:hypothetical protein